MNSTPACEGLLMIQPCFMKIQPGYRHTKSGNPLLVTSIDEIDCVCSVGIAYRFRGYIILLLWSDTIQ